MEYRFGTPSRRDGWKVCASTRWTGCSIWWYGFRTGTERLPRTTMIMKILKGEVKKVCFLASRSVQPVLCFTALWWSFPRPKYSETINWYMRPSRTTHPPLLCLARSSFTLSSQVSRTTSPRACAWCKMLHDVFVINALLAIPSAVSWKLREGLGLTRSSVACHSDISTNGTVQQSYCRFAHQFRTVRINCQSTEAFQIKAWLLEPCLDDPRTPR